MHATPARPSRPTFRFTASTPRGARLEITYSGPIGMTRDEAWATVQASLAGDARLAWADRGLGDRVGDVFGAWLVWFLACAFGAILVGGVLACFTDALAHRDAFDTVALWGGRVFLLGLPVAAVAGWIAGRAR